jgi:isopenicillin-N N-acyltransferase-like protein
MIRVLNLSGDPYSMGQQHGEQVSDLRPQIQSAIQTRLAALRQSNEDLTLYTKEITKVWERYAADTLEMLRGIAEALDLEWGEYFTYTVASYLSSRLKQTRQSDGCTTWAANGNFTRDGDSILAKNRDYHPDHQPLQCLARIRPRSGYPYLCLTSAGSPGVFSSGMNSAGLAVADTYVSSHDLGPGIARYSLMMDLLEKFTDVREAINYLFTRPHFGDGNVTLADAQGDMAVFEIAHTIQGVRQSDEGFIVSTNHFTAPETRQCWVDNEPPYLRGNSQERRRQVENALLSERGQVDLAWSQTLMAQHGGSLRAICRHPEIEAQSVTISSVIYMPQKASLYIANGLPCQSQFELFNILE